MGRAMHSLQFPGLGMAARFRQTRRDESTLTRGR